MRRHHRWAASDRRICVLASTDSLLILCMWRVPCLDLGCRNTPLYACYSPEHPTPSINPITRRESGLPAKAPDWTHDVGRSVALSRGRHSCRCKVKITHRPSKTLFSPNRCPCLLSCSCSLCYRSLKVNLTYTTAPFSWLAPIQNPFTQMSCSKSLFPPTHPSPKIHLPSIHLGHCSAQPPLCPNMAATPIQSLHQKHQSPITTLRAYLLPHMRRLPHRPACKPTV